MALSICCAVMRSANTTSIAGRSCLVKRLRSAPMTVGGGSGGRWWDILGAIGVSGWGVQLPCSEQVNISMAPNRMTSTLIWLAIPADEQRLQTREGAGFC